ncbi:MAG: M20/M25/M40 family metallo-hydrolase, partial [Methanomicrobium sp.]|nr:M20/M25/M40 family metallo-hydrolase [Methanomicrobium sp.]
MLLNAHIDTVRPASGYSRDPFVPSLEGDRLYGLGSNDDGGSVVALLDAYQRLTRKPQPYRLIYSATAEEEICGKGGIESILDDLGPVALGIIGEPTGMQMAVAERGLLVLDCTAHGISGHAARNEGVNALYKAMDDIQWFRNYRFGHTSDFLGEVKMTVTMIECGTQHEKDDEDKIDSDDSETDSADMDSDETDDYDTDKSDISDDSDSNDTATGKLTLGNICTGQTFCYDTASWMSCPLFDDDFYGQDAQYAEAGTCKPQNFTVKTVSEQNMIVDNNTGLEWQEKISTETYTFEEAENYCGESVYGGYSDWRVPSPQELLTIVDSSRFNPATNSIFTDMPDDKEIYLWTSKESRYFVVAEGLYSYYGNNENRYNVLCIRGGKMPKALFTSETVKGNIVVTDSTTDLIWQKDSAYTGSWKEALKYCEDLDYAGYTTWRLPNKNEAASLLNLNRAEAPYSDFPDMPVDGFWSSTSYGDGDLAWWADFYSGRVFRTSKEEKFAVRCVTGGNGVKLANPCDPNPCENLSNSTGDCRTISEKLYSCGC